jgi:hypothetical protein
MPAIRGPADLAGAMGALAGAAAQGAITPGEAAHLCQIIETLARAIETTEFDRRLRQLEAALAAVP